MGAHRLNSDLITGRGMLLIASSNEAIIPSDPAWTDRPALETFQAQTRTDGQTDRNPDSMPRKSVPGPAQHLREAFPVDLTATGAIDVSLAPRGAPSVGGRLSLRAAQVTGS
jgi:hypothetical protein